MNQRRDARAHQNAQNGVGELDEELPERLQLGQGGEGGLHGLDAHEQKAQPQENLAPGPLVAPGEKRVEHDANKSEDRSQHLRAEEQEEQIVAGQPAQTEDLRGDRGADVGAHNHAHRLPQLQNPGVDEANAHDGGGGGRVDHAGNHRAQKHALQNVIRQLFQQRGQLAAGQLFQSGGHGGHAEQEGSQSAQQGNQIGQRQNSSPFSIYFAVKKCLLKLYTESRAG